MIDRQLLEILVCPENQSSLAMAEPELLNKLNRAIAEGRVVNRAGQPVKEPFEAGLVREDGKLFYSIVDGIPVMLIDEAVSLEALD